MSDNINLIKHIAYEILAGNIIPLENEIATVLVDASDQYHNDGESYLTDADYDKLELMLKEINPNHPFLVTVGSEVRGGKIVLPVPLGSLDQVYEDDTIKWIKANGWENEWFVLSNKEDGTSGLLCYDRKRSLSIAYSRGNGIQGADITRHIKPIRGVPLKSTEPCMIRVEVIMEEEEFAKQKAAAEASGERVYKNARNYVAGRMNASESPKSFYESVKIIGTSVVEPKMSKQNQFKFMADMGFDIPYYELAKGYELTDTFLTEYLNERRAVSKTAIDGIVIDLDNESIRASLRRKSSSLNPMYSRKYKISALDNTATATVVAVHWEPSKSGYLKPKIEIEPIDLVGVTIRFCSGFNAAFIEEGGIGKGAKITMIRAGEVIPYCEKVLVPVTPDLPDQEEYGLWEWNETHVDAVLLNPEDSERVQINQLKDAFAALEIPNLREGSIMKLYDHGFSTIASIIKAEESSIINAVGDANGRKIFAGLKAKLNPVPLGILAGSVQVMGRGVGRRKMTKLVEALGQEKILSGNVTVPEVCAVESFEEKTAEVVVQNLPKLKEFLKEIKGYYTLAEKKETTMGELTGQFFVFTGVRDKSLETALEERGAVIQSSVNKQTTYLIAKDPTSNSGKIQKARDAGVHIISLDNAWANMS